MRWIPTTQSFPQIAKNVATAVALKKKSLPKPGKNRLMRLSFFTSMCLLGNLEMFKDSLNICEPLLIAYAYCRTSTPRQSELHVTDFYCHLPPDIPKDNQKAVAQFIVDRLGHQGEYQFTPDRDYTMSKRARGHTSCFAGAHVYEFHCSQRHQPKYISSKEYGKTRNRLGRVISYNCSGKVTITFPSIPSSFDFTLHNAHPFHPGRPFFGTPKYIRKWIFDNPRSTPRRQREDLLQAIAKGEVPGASERFLKPVLIHYWWRKAYREKKQPSDDPWENMCQLLEEHSSVLIPPFGFSWLTFQKPKVVLECFPRPHLIFFVGKGLFKVDYSKVSEIFVDATFSISNTKMHLYAILSEELGYGVPLGYMLMQIGDKENATTEAHKREALECNRHFFGIAKELGINPKFVHTDKDWSEITAVCHHQVGGLAILNLVESFSATELR